MLQLGKALTILTEDDVVQIKNGKQQTRLLLNVGKMKRDVSISAEDFVKALREVKLKKIAKKVIHKFLKKTDELTDRCGEAKKWQDSSRREIENELFKNLDIFQSRPCFTFPNTLD